jgi:predicted ester cyclase
MRDIPNRRSASSAIAVFRRYVTDFVNRHDFSAIGEFMAEDYTLISSGHRVSSRDGAYRSAVARQLDQFPGLVFTPHEIVHVGDRIAIRFTEHGADARDGRRAAWPSIAIYRVQGGLLASCNIEQDYLSRRRQLQSGNPVLIDAPAIAPWDTAEASPDPEAQAAVTAWLNDGTFIRTAAVQIDDSRTTGVIDRIIDGGALEFLDIVSGDGKVAFHAIQSGPLAGDFGSEIGAGAGQQAFIHLSGLVTVSEREIISGNVIRDRLGLHRRLGSQASAN